MESPHAIEILPDASPPDPSSFSRPRQPVEPLGSHRQHYPAQALRPG